MSNARKLADLVPDGLDLYEEGTWSVTWDNLTGTPGNTTGYYVKIGTTVFISYNSGTGTISGTGNQVTFNLPFVPDKNAAGSMIRSGVDFGGEILFFTNGKCYPLTFNHEDLNFSGTYLVA